MRWDVVRRWVATMAVAVVVAAGCATAGLWQWHRYQTVSAAVAVVERNVGAPAAPIEERLAPGTPVTADEVWQSVEATGHYLPGSTVLLRNRPVGGAQGFHELAGFAIDTGRLAGAVLVVDRGWIPVAADASSPQAVAALPVGPVDLVAQLRMNEAATDRSAPPGQVQMINAAMVRAAAEQPWPGTTLDAYGAVVSENGQGTGLGALNPPSTDLGPHLSYTFQWAVFAIGSLVGAVILLRREDVPDGAEDQPVRARSGRRSTAEQEEDAFLDAQESAADR